MIDPRELDEVELALMPGFDTHAQLANRVALAHKESPVRITPTRALLALELIDVLPDDVPTPDLRIALDGALALVWEQGSKTLVLRPELDGWVTFGVEFGSERKEGREVFIYPKMPEVVGEILSAFVRCDA